MLGVQYCSLRVQYCCHTASHRLAEPTHSFDVHHAPEISKEVSIIQALFNYYDSDKSGGLDYNEFVSSFHVNEDKDLPMLSTKLRRGGPGS